MEGGWNETNLIESFRMRFPDTFTYDGNRRIVFAEDEKISREPLSLCIGAALTYHRDKRS